MKNSDKLIQAYQYCQSITKKHYENFPVASFLIPSDLRKHVYAIYAFARHADDLSDEKHDKNGLLQWRELLHQSIKKEAEHPIFIALSDTIQKFNLPVQLFDNLILAFLQDLEKNRYNSFDDLFSYCEKSANPVGRIILYLNDYRDDKLFQYSDDICTALQLTNFWQDVTIDFQKDRIYIPGVYLQKYDVTENQIEKRTFDDNFRNLMIQLVDKTNELFENGENLLKGVKGPLKWELKFTVTGGKTILNKIKQIDYNVLNYRPTLNKLDWVRISLNLLFNKNGRL
jgi:squalene synthase HpnC